MTLVSLLLTLALDRLLLAHRDPRVREAYDRLLDAVVRRLPDNWNGVVAAVLLVLPAVGAVAVIQWLVSGWLFGLVSAVVTIAVVLLMLGPLDIVTEVDEYIAAQRTGDERQLAYHFERLTGEVGPIGDAQAEANAATRAILYQGHDHLFATLFWFCVLGPLGAVLYRFTAQAALQPSAQIASNPARVRALRDILALLGWVPARLLAFGYALTGSFDAAVNRLRAGVASNQDGLAGNRALLAETGLAALSGSAEWGTQDDPGAAPRAARALVIRAALFWLAILALLTLTGFVG